MSLEIVAPTPEGGSVMVCVSISDVPADGLDCDVTVPLSALDGKASGWNSALFLCGNLSVDILFLITHKQPCQQTINPLMTSV